MFRAKGFLLILSPKGTYSTKILLRKIKCRYGLFQKKRMDT